jgi:hypothetical protein
VRKQFDAYYESLSKVETTTTNAKTALEKAALAADGNAKALAEVAKIAGDYEVKMEQIASNERIKLIESTMKLNIADVEANAKVATAILNTISETYTADTSLIGDLMSQVKDGYSTADKLRMEMAEDANRRVEELHAAQLKIIDAQVEYLQMKAMAMATGTPVMTVSAEGLQPHLEAMMWEIFKQIQIQMALDGGDLLVGGLT